MKLMYEGVVITREGNSRDSRSELIFPNVVAKFQIAELRIS